MTREETNDVISRQAVLDAINNNRFRYTVAKEDACTGNVLWDSDLIDSNVVQDISNLPCVTPEEMQKCKDIVKKYTPKQQPCDDAVSRKAVDELSKELVHTTRDKADFLCNFWEGLQKLPPVTPQQKYGKWIKHPEIETSTPEYLMFYECSECGDKQCFCKSDIHKKRFCSNCGAKMQESEEE